jgi:hypothetical protein
MLTVALALWIVLDLVAALQGGRRRTPAERR